MHNALKHISEKITMIEEIVKDKGSNDYEGVNIALIENVIRTYLPKIKNIIISQK